MPTYPFECPTCGHQEDIRRTISGRDDPCVCAHCYADMVRQIVMPNTIIGPDLDIPIHKRGLVSDALGVHPSQVAEARKNDPDGTYNDQGQMIFKNRAEKKKWMKKNGFHCRSD